MHLRAIVSLASRWFIALLISTFLFGLAGCGQAPSRQGTYSVDPLFKDFYQELGGEDYLGPLISIRFSRGSVQCQYTLNALLCFDASLSGLGQYYLEPVGNQLDVKDDPQPYPEQASERVINGYPIFSDFIPLYDSLYGALYVGRPLTNPRYNVDQQRVEQYFENVGFYHRFDEPANTAHLLEYGAYSCQDECRYRHESFIASRSVQSPFVAALERYGGMAIFGRPLNEPTVAADGYLEQVFENVIVYAPVDQPAQFHFRPLPFQVGIPAIVPGKQRYGVAENVIFYTIDGVLGYHVPILFDQFITEHGGMEFSGSPISDPSYYPGVDHPRQCFENYCLDYIADAESGEKIRLAPLGTLYLQKIQADLSYEISSANVSFLMNESNIQIGAEQPQTIQVVVYETSSGHPVANVEARLVLTAPDGRQYTYSMPPTNERGITSVTVPPLPGLNNGKLMLYQVCLNLPQPPPCTTDSYLIWQ